MEINATLIGQLITFAVLVWFTMRYVWPPITQAMSEREKKIAAGLAAAERGKQELEEAARKAILIINEAKCDAAELMEQARKHSSQLVEEAKQMAGLEAERLLHSAHSEIENEIGRAKEMLRKQLAPLVVKGAEKIIQRNLSVTDDAHLLDQLVAEI